MKRKSVTITAKVLCFLLVFGILFSIVQWVFQYKGEDEFYLKERFDSYQKAVENGEEIDVVALGTSGNFSSIVPMILYKESGITSFNFGVLQQNAMCEYYLLKSLLEIHVPKVIILDMHPLLDDRKAEGNFDYVYLRTIDNLPDNKIRQELIDSVIAENKEKDPIELMIPMLRLHSRWGSLDKKDYLLNSNYEEYQKGYLLRTVFKDITDTDYLTEAERLQETEFREISQSSMNWYEKIFSLCDENDIQIVVVTMPNTSSSKNAPQYATYARLCQERGIPYFNYATQEQIARTQLNASTDYFDEGHLNLRGGIKVSRALTQDMKAQFQLEDKRGNSAYSSWNDSWDEFYTAYKAIIDKYYFKGSKGGS